MLSYKITLMISNLHIIIPIYLLRGKIGNHIHVTIVRRAVHRRTENINRRNPLKREMRLKFDPNIVKKFDISALSNGRHYLKIAIRNTSGTAVVSNDYVDIFMVK